MKHKTSFAFLSLLSAHVEAPKSNAFEPQQEHHVYLFQWLLFRFEANSIDYDCAAWPTSSDLSLWILLSYELYTHHV